MKQFIEAYLFLNKWCANHQKILTRNETLDYCPVRREKMSVKKEATSVVYQEYYNKSTFAFSISCPPLPPQGG